MGSCDERSVRSDELPEFGHLNQSIYAVHHAALITGHCLGFAQRTTALLGRPSLLHRRERPFLIRVIEPPAFPKIA
jgi:hypothetical protein